MPTNRDGSDKTKTKLQEVKSFQKEKFIKKYKLPLPVKETVLETFFRELLLMFGINNLDPATHAVDTTEIMTLIVSCGTNRMFEDEIHAFQDWYSAVINGESNTLMALFALKKIISLSSKNDNVDWMYDVYSKYIDIRQGSSGSLQSYLRRYDENAAWTKNEFRCDLKDARLDLYLFLKKMTDRTYASVKARFLAVYPKGVYTWQKIRMCIDYLISNAPTGKKKSKPGDKLLTVGGLIKIQNH